MPILAYLLTVILLLPATAAWPQVAEAPPHAVPRSHQTDIVASGGATYRILVARPAAPAPAAGYPVLYVLDGNAMFGTLVDLVRRAEQGGPAAGAQPLIVAIGYPTDAAYDIARRSYDYTPPAPLAEPERRPDGTPYPRSPHGGADAFLDFLQRELHPSIARDFPVDASRRALLGHSYGGLLVLHALFTRPQAFRTYVAASPSLWWNGGWIAGEEAAFLAGAAGHSVDARLLLSVGEHEQDLSPRESRSMPAAKAGERRRHLQRRAMVDAITALAGRLAGHPGLTVSFRVHEDETHLSVVPVAYARALPLLWED